MPHESVESLKREIADLRNRLLVRLGALRELELAEELPLSEEEQSETSFKSRVEFVNMPPIDAIEKLLRKVGRPLRPGEIIQALIAGGASLNKKRNTHNLRISIEQNLESGRLVFHDSCGSIEDRRTIAGLVAEDKCLICLRSPQRHPN